MRFIEMTGRQLLQIVNEGELTEEELTAAGVDAETVVRVNQQGDIEVRRPQGWDVVGGLIGEFEQRVKQTTGLDWS